jgi:hypothetical protein
MYFYVYIILLVFILGLYSTYERKHAAFGFEVRQANLRCFGYNTYIHGNVTMKLPV